MAARAEQEHKEAEAAKKAAHGVLPSGSGGAAGGGDGGAGPAKPFEEPESGKKADPLSLRARKHTTCSRDLKAMTGMLQTAVETANDVKKLPDIDPEKDGQFLTNLDSRLQLVLEVLGSTYDYTEKKFTPKYPLTDQGNKENDAEVQILITNAGNLKPVEDSLHCVCTQTALNDIGALPGCLFEKHDFDRTSEAEQ